MRVATLEEVLRYGSRGDQRALRARGLLPPIGGAAGLGVDPSTTAIFGQTGSTSVVSSAFSPPAGSLLLIGVGHTTSVGLSAFGMTDSLAGHLSYSNPIAVVEGTNHAYAQFWLAQVGGSAPGSMTITASWTGTSSFHDAIAVLILTGAAASQVGAATGSSTSAAGAPSASLTTTAGGSWVFGWITNQTNTTAPTIPGGQTDVFNGLTMRYAPAGDSQWMQGTSVPTTSAGTLVTINDTAPSVEYAMALLEILAAPVLPSGPPVSYGSYFYQQNR